MSFVPPPPSPPSPSPSPPPLPPLMSSKSFVLPGHIAKGNKGLIAAMALAYCRRLNNRRLECHSYGFWASVFASLVADLEPNAIVVPQFRLDNPTFLSADLSTETMPDQDADEVTPDFTILLIKIAARGDVRARNITMTPSYVFGDWCNITISALGVPLISEVKRPPMRNLPRNKFIRFLEEELRRVKHQLMEQAVYAFDMHHNRMKTLVLIGSAGEWWIWRIITHETISMESKNPVHWAKDKMLIDIDISEDEDENASDPDVDYQPGNSDHSSHGSEVADNEGGDRAEPRRNPARAKRNIAKDDLILPKIFSTDLLPYDGPLGPRIRVDEKHGSKERHGSKKNKSNRKVPIKATGYKLNRDIAQSDPEYIEPLRKDKEIDAIKLSSSTPWSKWICFGTETSAQNLYVIHRFITNARNVLLQMDASGAEPTQQTAVQHERVAQVPSHVQEAVERQETDQGQSGQGPERRVEQGRRSRTPHKQQPNAEAGPSHPRRK